MSDLHWGLPMDIGQYRASWTVVATSLLKALFGLMGFVLFGLACKSSFSSHVQFSGAHTGLEASKEQCVDTRSTVSIFTGNRLSIRDAIFWLWGSRWPFMSHVHSSKEHTGLSSSFGQCTDPRRIASIFPEIFFIIRAAPEGFFFGSSSFAAFPSSPRMFLSVPLNFLSNRYAVRFATAPLGRLAAPAAPQEQSCGEQIAAPIVRGQ
mmetsp:Transcript_8243/g.16092  ORF Transcript_8243/g.16092 Transcript_8243/m.16092 type:complete len:207 (+) Transcript_8243:164-784(+)